MIDQIRSARTPSAGDKERIRKMLAMGVAATARLGAGSCRGCVCRQGGRHGGNCHRVQGGRVGGGARFRRCGRVHLDAAVAAAAGSSRAGGHRLRRSCGRAGTAAPRWSMTARRRLRSPRPLSPSRPWLRLRRRRIRPGPRSADGRGRAAAQGAAGLAPGQRCPRAGPGAAAARRYPHSVLALERDALRVFALCSLGQRAQARPLAADLLRRAPGSPLRTSVEESCGGR